ncbi:MAG: helix-turn-helix domain-containing protein, partial [Candidatus Paceibacterota bacterium]
MSLLIAPLEALTDALLSDPERRVLLSLFSFRGKNTNTVWPSVESIAERANINDHTRVSKLTASLASKGWLTKKKRGFTGGNEYKLDVPARLDTSTNLDSDAKLVPDTKPNLDSDASSNLDSDAKYKEETSEQTSEEVKQIHSGITFDQ